MAELRRDLRFALRAMARNPLATLLVVLVLAVGIGANSAIFALVNALLLRPIHAHQPEHLQSVMSREREGSEYRGFSKPNWRDLAEQNTSFDQLAAQTVALAGLREGETTRRAFVFITSANYFATFGVAPLLGRTFDPAEEDAPARVAVLSHTYYRRHGASPALVGSTVTVNGLPFTVVGVMPPGFTGTTVMFSPDLWVPLGDGDALLGGAIGASGRPLDQRDNHALMLIGRPRPGLERERASADVARVAALLAAAFPGPNRGQTFEVHPLSRLSISTAPESDNPIAAMAALLLAMAGIVLLVATLNLATMERAKAIAREREAAVRLALGAPRRHVLRPLLLESLLHALLGGAFGLLAALALPRAIASSMQRMLPIQIELPTTPDWRVLLATLGFCLLATVLFGLGPGLRLSRVPLSQELTGRGAAATSARSARLFQRANLPVLCELALTTVLLVAAGLFLKAALEGARVEPGFDLSRGVLLETDASLLGYDPTRGRETYRRVLARLAALPGVERAALAATTPFGIISLGRRVEAEGTPTPATGQRDEEGDGAAWNCVSADYFDAMGIPILAGRSFREPESAPVAVIDTTLADRLFPDGDALGRTLRFVGDDAASSTGPREVQVVGIAGAVRGSLFDRGERATVYVPFDQEPQQNVTFHARAAAASAAPALVPAVGAAVAAIDPRLPVLALRTMREHVDRSADLWLLRTGARVFAVFAALALLLAIAGVYGLRAMSVARRRQEIGLRMALGASVRSVLGQMLREGLRLTVAGAALGLVLALAVARLLQSFLVDLSAFDPAVFALALVLLGAASLGACYLPARRAARLDPLEALRHE